ncbi:MAG: hypothetical protein HN712_04625 [Gemmatimonadetes bacterium]|jgi:4-amino-4-deoxy-L-arabinose transferase-like glycosyltransferase|nr:hypothetical protein [Gemmatimonadota bacterium]MBT7859570.1 hypothetical protein [Gemmatimonadota bacterium]
MSRSAGVVLLVALAARLVYVGADIEVPPQDTPDYDEIAMNLLAGEGFVSHDTFFGYPMRSWRAPLYPTMLAAIYGIFGVHHGVVLLIQALIGAWTAVGILHLARWLHPPSALLTALLVALYPPLIANAAEVMTETLFTALLVAGAGMGLRLSNRLGWWGAGLLIALATLTRPVGLLLAPALFLPPLWVATRGALADPSRLTWQSQTWPAAVSRAGWILAGLLMGLAPWTIRNAQVHGAFVPVSTHAGFILARSNADDPDWRRQDGWQIRPEVFARIPNEVERDRAWRAQGKAWIVDHPTQWLRWVTERFLRFWYVFRPDYNIGFVLVLPLMLVGVFRVGWSPPYRELSLFAGLSIFLFSTLLYGSTRFRLPLEPFFLLYAGPALHAAWQSPRRRTWLGACAAWATVHTLIWWQQDAIRMMIVSWLTSSGLK